MCLSDSVFLNVSGEDSVVKLWEKLGSLYQSKSLVNKLFLQKKLFHLSRVKLKLKDGRIRTLPRVLHIPNLARNLISIGNMDVVGVNTVCGDDGCKMVRGSMVLMRGVWYGTLYKLLGKTIIDECNNYVVLEEGGKDDKTLTTSGGKTML